MKVLQVFIGAILVGIAYQTQDKYSPIMLVQGMLMINFGLSKIFSKKESLQMR